MFTLPLYILNITFKKPLTGTFLVVQRLRLWASNVKNVGSISGWRTKIPHDTAPPTLPKKNKQKKKKENWNFFFPLWTEDWSSAECINHWPVLNLLFNTNSTVLSLLILKCVSSCPKTNRLLDIFSSKYGSAKNCNSGSLAMASHMQVPTRQRKENTFITGQKSWEGYCEESPWLFTDWKNWQGIRVSFLFLLASSIVSGHEHAPF